MRYSFITPIFLLIFLSSCSLNKNSSEDMELVIETKPSVDSVDIKYKKTEPETLVKNEKYRESDQYENVDFWGNPKAPEYSPFINGNTNREDNVYPSGSFVNPFGNGNQAQENNSYQPRLFMGNPCTSDCSGHQAGYDWAEENNIDDESDCDNRSLSFEEGCISYVNENI